MPQKPTETFRSGGIEISLWENEGQISTTVRKQYKGKDDKWHESKSLFPNDLPVVASLLLMAHQFIVTKQ